jgi:hypothetical protein
MLGVLGDCDRKHAYYAMPFRSSPRCWQRGHPVDDVKAYLSCAEKYKCCAEKYNVLVNAIFAMARLGTLETQLLL